MELFRLMYLFFVKMYFQTIKKDFIMSEPRLENIEDYDTLKGEKRRIVWAVVLAGLIIGVIYVVASNVYGSDDDSIPVEKSIRTIPLQ